MISNNVDIQAGLLVLGSLPADEHEAARLRQLQDADFSRAGEAWETRLLPLALAGPPVQPPAGPLARIEAKLDERAATGPRGATIRADEGKWQRVAAGIASKVLHRMLPIGRQTILVKVEAGAVYDGHDHDEELYLISGDLTIGGVELRPGDFHLAPKGSRHPAATTRGGCLCLFVMGV